MSNSSGRNNADFNVEKGELRIWDPSFQNNDQVADFSVIKTNKTPWLEATDDTLPTTKYINEHYQLKDRDGNDWEIVNTSDFIRNSKEYTVRAFDNKYYYRINCSVETQFRIYGFTIFVNPKFISEQMPTTYYIGTSIEGYSSIFEWDKNTNYGEVTIEKEESAQYLNGIYIERKRIS